MPYAENGGVRIYYEIEGVGPPMVLVRGFSYSLESRREYGYDEGLEKCRYLILTDARGHGASDKPHDTEAYGLAQRPAEIGGQRVGLVQGLRAVRNLLALPGIGRWQARSSSPSERCLSTKVGGLTSAVRNTYLPSRSRLTGIVQLAFRLPIYLYRTNLRWLSGHRFLRLTHRGRKSGRARHTVLEVLRYDPTTRESIAVSAWGEDSDWYRNLLAAPAVQVRPGRERYAPAQRFLKSEEVYAAVADYEDRHPLSSRLISRMLGSPLDGTEAARRNFASRVRIVAFSPMRTTLGRE